MGDAPRSSEGKEISGGIENIFSLEGQALLVGTFKLSEVWYGLSSLLGYKFHEAMDNFQFVYLYVPSMEHEPWNMIDA